MTLITFRRARPTLLPTRPALKMELYPPTPPHFTRASRTSSAILFGRPQPPDRFLSRQCLRRSTAGEPMSTSFTIACHFLPATLVRAVLNLTVARPPWSLVIKLILLSALVQMAPSLMIAQVFQQRFPRYSRVRRARFSALRLPGGRTLPRKYSNNGEISSRA